jgi:hypothetical protein
VKLQSGDDNSPHMRGMLIAEGRSGAAQAYIAGKSVLRGIAETGNGDHTDGKL